MYDEEKANRGAKVDSSEEEFDRITRELKKVEEELRRLDETEEEEPEYEPVTESKEEMRALPEQVLEEQVDVLRERLELDQRKKELDRRAFKLGMLKLADQTPRCAHMKSNGVMCRAPAVNGRFFCIFHQRAIDAREHARIDVLLPEDRQTVQLILKQVMDHVASGRIDLKTASVLLRALQVANSTLPSRRAKTQRKPVRKPPKSYDGEGNPQENSA